MTGGRDIPPHPTPPPRSEYGAGALRQQESGRGGNYRREGPGVRGWGRRGHRDVPWDPLDPLGAAGTPPPLQRPLEDGGSPAPPPPPQGPSPRRDLSHADPPVRTPRTCPPRGAGTQSRLQRGSPRGPPRGTPRCPAPLPPLADPTPVHPGGVGGEPQNGAPSTPSSTPLKSPSPAVQWPPGAFHSCHEFAVLSTACPFFPPPQRCQPTTQHRHEKSCR